MKHTGLMLPHKCQTAGWIIIALPFFLLGILLLLQLFVTEYQFTQLTGRYSWILISSPTGYIFFRYLGHFIFCFQFPVYFLLFKFMLYINRKRNEE